MIRKDIPGYNKTYLLEELIRVKQNMYPFGIPENGEVFYHQNLDYKEQAGEIFKKVYEYFKKPVEVSNFGRVRYDNEIIQQVDDPSHQNGGWLWLECPQYKFLHHQYVYRLVADAWLKSHPNTDDKWARHHINNNGYDNRPENLIWVTAEEHAKIHHYVED